MGSDSGVSMLVTSQAFENPVHPTRSVTPNIVSEPSPLPVEIPPSTLRPLAFRIFTKKHGLNITSSALKTLAISIGRSCGSRWREDGSAERVLDETAKQWKKTGDSVVVSGESPELESILSHSLNLETSRTVLVRRPSASHVQAVDPSSENDSTQSDPGKQSGRATSHFFSVETEDAVQEEARGKDIREWMRVVSASEHPRLLYNSARQHFEILGQPSSILPQPLQKSTLFRQRYQLTHQRLMRNEAFRSSASKSKFTGLAARTGYHLTQISNLLGRNGTSHVLLGLLSWSPSGYLTITDLTGSVRLDTNHVYASGEGGHSLFAGMIVIVDGQYEEGDSMPGTDLNGQSGIGGTIGGVFVVHGLTGPPSESRATTLGLTNHSSMGAQKNGDGFGWVDFLGTGSDKAVGKRMRALEDVFIGQGQNERPGSGRCRIVMLGEAHLDKAKTLQAIRKILTIYSTDEANEMPMAFVLMGSFINNSMMAGAGEEASIEYKECFDSLAAVLSEFPSLLQHITLIVVPGDQDPWSSTFSAGASTLIPRGPIPDIFTSRIRKAFATANADHERETGKKSTGEAIWSTNPARLTVFGPRTEIVLFKDDILGRLRRNALHLGALPGSNGVESTEPPETGRHQQSVEAEDTKQDDAASSSHADAWKTPDKISPSTQIARRLVKTLIDQAHLSPFPLDQRPVMWDQASALSLYPLPCAIMITDTEAPAFATGLDGCHVMNCGPLISSDRKGVVQWIEYSIRTQRGRVREAWY